MQTGILPWLVLTGLVCATLALALRRAELARPAPRDIAAKGGLGHLLVGAFAGLALIALVIGAIFALGLVLPMAAVLILLAAGRLAGHSTLLVPLYRFQLGFAVAATFLALILWFNIILLIQGVS